MRQTKTRLISYLGILALLMSLVFGLLGHSNSQQNITEIKNRLLHRHLENNIKLTMKYLVNSYGTLSLGKSTLLDKDGNSIENNHQFVDLISEDLGEEATIFVKEKNDFKRISTNVMSNEKNRAIGTYLGRTHVAYEKLLHGEVYIGEANILGEPYYTAYQPIKDQNKNVIGVLFVGLPTKSIDQLIEVHESKMTTIDILIIVFRAISLGSLITLVGMAAFHNRTEGVENKK